LSPTLVRMVYFAPLAAAAVSVMPPRAPLPILEF
jgi:hypothetical protein